MRSRPRLIGNGFYWNRKKKKLNFYKLNKSFIYFHYLLFFLFQAVENNSLQIVDVLLRAGAETNIYDIHHMTALHIAAANGNADIGQMLANRDAKLDAKDMVCQ